MCSESLLYFSSRLCSVTKQEIEFFPCTDIVSYFLLLLLVCDWPSKRWHLKGICRGSLCPKYQVNHGLKFNNIFSFFLKLFVILGKITGCHFYKYVWIFFRWSKLRNGLGPSCTRLYTHVHMIRCINCTSIVNNLKRPFKVTYSYHITWTEGHGKNTEIV